MGGVGTRVMSTFWHPLALVSHTLFHKMEIKITIPVPYHVCSQVSAGIILYMRPANERRRYNVTLSLIGRAHIVTSSLIGRAHTQYESEWSLSLILIWRWISRLLCWHPVLQSKLCKSATIDFIKIRNQDHNIILQEIFINPVKQTSLRSTLDFT